MNNKVRKIDFKDGSIPIFSKELNRVVKFQYLKDRQGYYEIFLNEHFPGIPKKMYQAVISEITNHLIEEEYNQLLKEE
jgi:hypothetical protein